MEKSNSIWYITILLSAVAGYCDTVTFVAADSIFSAHVTGNFIVFAYQIIKGSDSQAWIKLLTFPVFVISVIIGGRIGSEAGKRYRLLLFEGFLLLAAGVLAVLFRLYDPAAWGTYLIAMIVVFAMGLQNAFGKLYGKETYGPTTMMTGNVTQASLDLGSVISSAFTNALSIESLKKQMITIGGFLVGCLAGALLAKFFGLYVLIAPGLVLLICYFITSKNSNVTVTGQVT
jgi:uncharacterized membrane protein YoaK (UPF0700 family)